MKFDELQTVGPVKLSGSGETKTFFRSSEGWDLSFEQGVVTIRKGEIHRVLPWPGVAWATPLRPKKAEAA